MTSNELVKQFMVKYTQELNHGLYKMCALYVTIGSGNVESPRWINFDEFIIKEDKNYIRFRSTQRSGIGFEFQITEKEMIDLSCCSEELWASFKSFRTDYLQKNYPTISVI